MMSFNTLLCDIVVDLEVFTVAYNSTTGATLTLIDSTRSGLRGTRSARSGPKLYAAITPGIIQYVGYTITSLSARINLGHRRRIVRHKGYGGYKWLHLSGLRLFVWHLSNLKSLATAANISPQHLAERLESELVFHIRATTGKWPASQHEIHFHNLAPQMKLAELATQTAQELYIVLISEASQS